MFFNIRTSGPVYEHDCNNCEYIATVYKVDGVLKVYDCYWCPSPHGIPTIITRHSSDGPDYVSGLVFAQRGHETLTLALELGIIRGIIDPNVRHLWQPKGLLK